MIRIALDIHTIGQQATGNETYISGLLNAFKKHPQTDLHFTYYHSRSLKDKKWPGTYKKLSPQSPFLRIPLSTPYALYRDNIDVSHFQYFHPLLSPCPAVVTIHDLSFEHHPEFFSPLMRNALRYLAPIMAKRAAHIITVSKATKQDLIEKYKLPSDKISVIYNSTSSSFHNQYKHSLLIERIARFNLPRPFVVSVGNLGPRKNQHRLIRCFSNLVENGDIDFDLVLVGQPVYKANAILDEIKKTKAKGRIHVTGFVNQDELVALYNLAMFSIYPSLFEGFGLPILESMACGTPVITSNCSCMPEIAKDAALLINPRDDDDLSSAMLELSTNSALREKLVTSGLQRTSDFSWERAADRTINVYRNITS
ncbi:MAG: glycosyltransferase involved in cell wall biosynthesis [Psychroserpens sp.]|jgi:glycosyltransferase involved in cell wall biosynthesis